MTVDVSPSTTRICPNCGAETATAGRFCRRCGAELAPVEGHVEAAPAAAQTSPELSTPATQQPANTVPAPQPAQVEAGLLTRARQNDRPAIETMFRQFVPADETISAAEYLGVYGLWGFGRDSFGIATDRRVAALQVGSFGEVLYQDASLEYVNSTVLYQPSRGGLYATVAVVALVTFGVGLLLAPVIARGYYRRKKSGLVLAVREGVSVYVFIDRSRMLAANRFCRDIAGLREQRVRRIGLS
jgi:hypothetical protein